MRYWRPWRLFLIRLTWMFPKWEWLDRTICEYLYPDDAWIDFGKESVPWKRKSS